MNKCLINSIWLLILVMFVICCMANDFSKWFIFGVNLILTISVFAYIKHDKGDLYD